MGIKNMGKSNSNKIGVFFTDGGARPNPGNSGAGIYGFTYDTSTGVEIDVKRNTTVFNHLGVQNSRTLTGEINRSMILAKSDSFMGQYLNDLKVTFTIDKVESAKGKVPVLLSIDGLLNYTPDLHYDVIVAIDDRSTNNRAELVALIEMLKLCIDLDCDEYFIYSDSQYAIRLCNIDLDVVGQRGWTNASGVPLSNVEEIKQIRDLKKKLDMSKVHIYKVKAHNDYYGNDRADVNATKGLIRVINNNFNIDNGKVKFTDNDKERIANSKSKMHVSTFTSKELERKTPSSELPRLINKRYIYTSKGIESLEAAESIGYKHMVVMGNHGNKSKDIARPTSNSSYSIAFLNEVYDPLIDVAKRTREFNEWMDVMVIDKTALFNPKVWSDYYHDGFNSFYPTSQRHNFTISSIYVSDIIEVMNTAWLAYHGFDILVNFTPQIISAAKGDGKMVITQDITDDLLTSETKVKKTKKGTPDITTVTYKVNEEKFIKKYTDIVVECDQYKDDKVRLLHNHDMPDRNLLNAYGKLGEVKVELCIIPKSADVYHFFTIVRTVDGCLISVGYPSNMKVRLPKK